jgi:methanogenic corrinoid protein MtbC1
MLRWCGYCQRYLGDSPPKDDCRITHVMCVPCSMAGVATNKDAIEQIEPIVRFQGRLRAVASRGVLSEAKTLLQEGLALGVRQLDLLVGIIQPMLCEVGEAWKQGRITASQEHRFTAFSSGVVLALHELHTDREKFLQSTSPKVLCFCVNGNFHELGLHFVELFLLDQRIASHVLTPCIPHFDIPEILTELRPEVVGLSVALREQMDALEIACSNIAEIAGNGIPKVAVGGAALQNGVHLPESIAGVRVHACAEPEDLILLLERA